MIDRAESPVGDKMESEDITDCLMFVKSELEDVKRRFARVEDASEESQAIAESITELEILLAESMSLAKGY